MHGKTVPIVQSCPLARSYYLIRQITYNSDPPHFHCGVPPSRISRFVTESAHGCHSSCPPLTHYFRRLSLGNPAGNHAICPVPLHLACQSLAVLWVFLSTSWGFIAFKVWNIIGPPKLWNRPLSTMWLGLSPSSLSVSSLITVLAISSLGNPHPQISPLSCSNRSRGISWRLGEIHFKATHLSGTANFRD